MQNILCRITSGTACNTRVIVLLVPLLFALVLAAAPFMAGHTCPCSIFQAPTKYHQQAAASPQKGLAFTGTSEYRRQFKQAIAEAYKTCRMHSGERNLAVVSDLDETLLDNRELMRRNYGSRDVLPSFASWVAQAKAPLLRQTADFIAWARKQGIAVFFVTGRKEAWRAATIENLVRNRVAYDGLYMRANDDTRPAADVKVKYRQDIENMGFKIIVNLGDQSSDLVGGHAEDCLLLPNEMYFVP